MDAEWKHLRYRGEHSAGHSKHDSWRNHVHLPLRMVTFRINLYSHHVGNRLDHTGHHDLQLSIWLDTIRNYLLKKLNTNPTRAIIKLPLMPA